MHAQKVTSMATVKNWLNKFQCFLMRLPAPKPVTTEDKVKKVHYVVLVDRRLKGLKVAGKAGNSKNGVNHILQEKVGMTEL